MIELPVLTDYQFPFYLTFHVENAYEDIPCQSSSSLSAILFDVIPVLLHRKAEERDLRAFRMIDEGSGRELRIALTVEENGLRKGSTVRCKSMSGD